MAQISTFTSDAQNFDPVAARATLNAVRTRLLGSKTIRAQDIRDIINVYNAWLQHKHVVYDNYYVAFGNKYAYATQGANIATEVPVLPTQITSGAGATSASFPSIAAGSNIILNDIRNLMALVNAIRSHLHQTNDGYL